MELSAAISCIIEGKSSGPREPSPLRRVWSHLILFMFATNRTHRVHYTCMHARAVLTSMVVAPFIAMWINSGDGWGSSADGTRVQLACQAAITSYAQCWHLALPPAAWQIFELVEGAPACIALDTLSVDMIRRQFTRIRRITSAIVTRRHGGGVERRSVTHQQATCVAPSSCCRSDLATALLAAV